MISLHSRGSKFEAAQNWFKRLNNIFKNTQAIHKYGEMGVQALASATPKESGETAAAWRYEIERNGETIRLSWHNDNINKGVNIAIILQYGHGTGTGGYVAGRDYINPAMRDLFDQMANDMWKEVTSV